MCAKSYKKAIPAVLLVVSVALISTVGPTMEIASAKDGDDSDRGSFSTSTDNRRGADKPEDDGLKNDDSSGGGAFSTSTDRRRGASKPEDNSSSSSSSSGVEDRTGGTFSTSTDNRGGASKPEDGVASGMEVENENENENETEGDRSGRRLSGDDKKVEIRQRVEAVKIERNGAKNKISDIKQKVENRGRVISALVGPDFKSIRLLKEETARIQNRINQLEELKNEADEEAEVAEVETEIEELHQEQAELSEFVEQKERRFSLFGWVARMFS